MTTNRSNVFHVDFAARRLVPVESTRVMVPAYPKEAMPLPAYCDPSNESRGSKYLAGRRTKEVAACVRADIKAAIASGVLPKGLKVSVRYESYSMGSSVNVNVTAAPTMLVLNPVRIAMQRADRPERELQSRHSPEMTLVLQTLKGIVYAYHRSNDDAQSDYFDSNFHAHIGVSSELETASREEIERTFDFFGTNF